MAEGEERGKIIKFPTKARQGMDKMMRTPPQTLDEETLNKLDELATYVISRARAIFTPDEQTKMEQLIKTRMDQYTLLEAARFLLPLKLGSGVSRGIYPEEAAFAERYQELRKEPKKTPSPEV